MSLRDKIAGELEVAYDDGQLDDGLDVHQIDRVINKVLDAAVEAVIDIYDEDFPPTAAVKAINKLRDES